MGLGASYQGKFPSWLLSGRLDEFAIILRHFLVSLVFEMLYF